MIKSKYALDADEKPVGDPLASDAQIKLAEKVDKLRSTLVEAGETAAAIKLRHAIDALNCEAVVEVVTTTPAPDTKE